MSMAAAASRSSLTLFSVRAGTAIDVVAGATAQPPRHTASSSQTLRRIGLLLVRLRDRGPLRHPDAKVCAGELAVHDFDRALVDIDELVEYRQTDTGAFDVTAGRAPGVEGVENARAL